MSETMTKQADAVERAAIAIAEHVFQDDLDSGVLQRESMMAFVDDFARIIDRETGATWLETINADLLEACILIVRYLEPGCNSIGADLGTREKAHDAARAAIAKAKGGEA